MFSLPLLGLSPEEVLIPLLSHLPVVVYLLMTSELPPRSSFFSPSSHLIPFPSYPRPFRFVGTNAYWLPALNSDDDIDTVLAGMAAEGITVVRLWAFNGADPPF